MPDSQDDVAAALLERYQKLCLARAGAQQNIERIQAHQRELIAQINDCLAAARVFGCEIDQSDPLTTLDGTHRSPKPFHVPSMRPRRGALTIRGLVLDAVERVYPNPIRASDIHRQLTKSGHAIHEKTVGMSLYRWSLETRVRREGRLDWFYVPPLDRQATKINGHHNGKTPASELFAPLGAEGFGL